MGFYMGKLALLEKINSLREDERQIICNSLKGDDEVISMTILKLYVPDATYGDMTSLHDMFVRH